MVKCYQKETPELKKSGNSKKMKEKIFVALESCGYIAFKDKNSACLILMPQQELWQRIHFWAVDMSHFFLYTV